MSISRRAVLGWGSAAISGALAGTGEVARAEPVAQSRDLLIRRVTVTPIALPDPPLLMAHGCHGPYFLRNVIEIETSDGITGLGETHGGERVTLALRRAAERIVGQSAFAYRRFAAAVSELGRNVYAGLELACLDAIGKATGRRLCELLGGPVRDEVEFASYLFFRFAADDPRVLDDARLVDDRGRGEQSLDEWGEVRSPESMADLAVAFHRRFGFRVHKLKAGVLSPEAELETLRAISARFDHKHLVRIDPNGRWTTATSIRIGRQLESLPLEYYEDPVVGQPAMADVREATGLPMSTNACVTAFEHIPPAIARRPIDVVLCDHHGWGGIPACQALGTMSRTLGWRVSQHSNNHAGITMAAMIHVGAVIPELTVASDTHYPWLVERDEIIEGGKLPIVDGKMAIPSAPGVGVRLDRDRLARAYELYERSGMRQRDDAGTMKRIDPGWSRELL